MKTMRDYQRSAVYKSEKGFSYKVEFETFDQYKDTGKVIVNSELHVSAVPHESVTIKVIVLTPATGVKQTVPLERAPLSTTTLIKLSSMSAPPNPGKQISDRSQTNISSSPGQVATGGLFSVIVTQ